jgi:hypothetical protein
MQVVPSTSGGYVDLEMGLPGESNPIIVEPLKLPEPAREPAREDRPPTPAPERAPAPPSRPAEEPVPV